MACVLRVSVSHNETFFFMGGWNIQVYFLTRFSFYYIGRSREVITLCSHDTARFPSSFFVLAPSRSCLEGVTTLVHLLVFRPLRGRRGIYFSGCLSVVFCMAYTQSKRRDMFLWLTGGVFVVRRQNAWFGCFSLFVFGSCGQAYRRHDIHTYVV